MGESITTGEPSTSPTTVARSLPAVRSLPVVAVGVMLVAANLRPAVVSVGPIVGEISDDLGLSGFAAGLLTTLPVLFFGVVAPAAPKVAARFGIERTIFAALLVLLVGVFIRLVPSVAALFVGSAVIGAAIGVCNVVLPALIKRDFAHRSGLMTGLYSMTLSGGAAVAAAITVPIDDAVGGNWRLTLASWGILTVITLVIWLPQLTRVHTMSASARTPSLRRNRIAWAITIFMGCQSLIFYTFAAWLPQYLVDGGMSRSSAGLVLAIAQVAALLASLVTPMIAGRFADQRLVTFLVLAICAVGFIGLVTTDTAPVFWAVCVMIGPGASISLALLFMVLRSNSTAQTGRVSGMAQAVGYGLAALGPIAIGGLHDLTGSWTIAMSVLGVAVIPQAVSAAWAARDVRMTPHRDAETVLS